MNPEPFLVVALLVIIVLVIAAHVRTRTRRIAKLGKDAEDFAARAAHGLTPISTRLLLKKNEHAFLEEESTLLETRAFRVWRGAGTRIAKVYIGGGVSESHQKVKQIDDGTLTLTNLRLVFDGSHENRNVQLSQVLSVRPWSDAIEVSLQRRAKSQVYRVVNPIIWCALLTKLAEGERHPVNQADMKFRAVASKAGVALQATPWRAVQRAAWAAVDR